MLLAALLLATRSAVDCEAFARQLDAPVAITAAPITARQLGGPTVEELAPAPGARSPSKIGELIYRGYGLELRSADPRLQGIKVRNSYEFAHDCGYTVWAPGGWNAFDKNQASRTLRFQKAQGDNGPPPGAIEAAAMGARPVLSGATAGPTWPVGSGSEKFFLGVMYPKGKRNESLVVAFANRPHGAPARVLARLRMHVQGISVLPAMHSSEYFLNLHERTPEGALRHVVLELDEPTRKRIARELAR